MVSRVSVRLASTSLLSKPCDCLYRFSATEVGGHLLPLVHTICFSLRRAALCWTKPEHARSCVRAPRSDSDTQGGGAAAATGVSQSRHRGEFRSTPLVLTCVSGAMSIEGLSVTVRARGAASSRPAPQGSVACGVLQLWTRALCAHPSDRLPLGGQRSGWGAL